MLDNGGLHRIIELFEARRPLGSAVISEPHDILGICGDEALQQFLITEIQRVYRSQNVRI